MNYRTEFVDNSGFLHLCCFGEWDAGGSRACLQTVAERLRRLEHGKVLLDDRGIELKTTISIDFDHAAFTARLMRGVCSKFAIVDNAENDSANRFFETVCVNRGLNLRFFLDEKAAVDWLSE